MRPMKRAFPLPFWLAAYLIPLTLILPGLLLLREDTAQTVFLYDISVFADIKGLRAFAARWETALNATALCLVVGYPAGCLLALWRRRTVFMAFFTPALFLCGAVVLYGQRLVSLLPRVLEPVLLLAEGLRVPQAAAMALVFLPVMILCTCSFAAAADPALYRTACGLGASRQRAFLTLIFPRTLKGLLAGSFLVFLPALALSLVPGQDAGISFSLAALISAVLLLLTWMIMTGCLLALNKARSVSPC